jgi:hypothetical protein
MVQKKAAQMADSSVVQMVEHLVAQLAVSKAMS